MNQSQFNTQHGAFSLLRAASFAVFLLMSSGQLYSQAKEIVIRCSVVNGTTLVPQTPDRAMLVLMKNIPETIQTLERPPSNFAFKGIETPVYPVLIRIEYRDVTYNSVLAEKDLKPDGAVKITVYERGAFERDVKISSMIQIIRKKDSLHVMEIYSVSNESLPKKIFFPENMYIPLSEKAKSIKVFIQHELAGMSSPKQVTETEYGKRLVHGFKPGLSGLSIEYDVSGNILSEKSLFVGDPKEQNNIKIDDYKTLIWQPSDAVPVVTGGKTIPINIPDFGEALRINYRRGEVIRYQFDRGSYVMDNPQEMWSNPVFDSAHKTLVGIILFFICISFVFYYAVNHESIFKDAS